MNTTPTENLSIDSIGYDSLEQRIENYRALLMRVFGHTVVSEKTTPFCHVLLPNFLSGINFTITLSEAKYTPRFVTIYITENNKVAIGFTRNTDTAFLLCVTSEIKNYKESIEHFFSNPSFPPGASCNPKHIADFFYPNQD